jgi:hypothetical protein
MWTSEGNIYPEKTGYSPHNFHPLFFNHRSKIRQGVKQKNISL